MNEHDEKVRFETAVTILGALISATNPIKQNGKLISSVQEYCEVAYIYADAMLAAREGK